MATRFWEPLLADTFLRRILYTTHHACRYYDDFHTIDWVRDSNRDKVRHKRIERTKHLSWRGWVAKFWDAGSGWLLVFLIGVSSGVIAGGTACVSMYV